MCISAPHPGLLPGDEPAHAEVVLYRHARDQVTALRHMRDAERDDAVGRRGRSMPSISMLPRTRRFSPEMTRISEKYAATESLRSDLKSAPMAVIRALYDEEGWEVNVGVLSDPSRLTYYFGVFRDDQKRKLLGVRQAAQFKGVFKARFLSIADDTLRMIPDRVFKLDHQFDFLITASHVYVLRPTGFERIAEVEEYASAKAREMTVALGETVKFLDFSTLADYVGIHKRAARLVAALHARGDLHVVKRSMFCKAAEESGVLLQAAGRKVAPTKGSELACLELLDYRRYTIALAPGRKPAFVAGSRRQVRLATAAAHQQ